MSVLEGLDSDSATISRRQLMRLLGIGGGALGSSWLSSSAFAAPGVDDHSVLRVLDFTQGDRPELVVGTTGLPAVLDPGQGGYFSIVGSRLTPIFFDPLLDIDFRDSDPAGFGSKIVPNIAASWTRLDDLTMEVKLRDDVFFHDGSKLTADDVKFSIDRIIAPDADPKTAVVAALFVTYDRVEVIDPLTVHIVTKAPDAVVDMRLTQLYVTPKTIVESAGLDDFALHPVGTGAYKVTEFVANDHLTFEAFDQYFGGLPPFSKVTIRMIPEVATRIAAILSGEVQLVSDVTPDQIAVLQADDALNVNSIASNNAHFIFFNTKQPLLNKQMRQGLSLGVDRQLLIDTLWLGNADLMRGYQVPQWGAMYNADRPLSAYDPDKSKELIAASGYNGEEILLRAPAAYYTLGADAAQAIVSMWQDIGVNAKADLVDTAALLQNREAIQVCFTSAGLAPNDPTATFSGLWDAKGIFQTSFWTPESPAFNENLQLLTQTLDMQARYDAYQQVLDIMDDEAPATLLYRVYSIYGQKKTVGWTPYTVFNMDLRAPNIIPES